MSSIQRVLNRKVRNRRRGRVRSTFAARARGGWRMRTAMLQADTFSILPPRPLDLLVAASGSCSPAVLQSCITRAETLRHAAAAEADIITTNCPPVSETVLCTRDGPQPTTHRMPCLPQLPSIHCNVTCATANPSPAGTTYNMIPALYTMLPTIHTMLSFKSPPMNSYNLNIPIKHVRSSGSPPSTCYCATPSANHQSYAPAESPVRTCTH